MAQSHVAAPGWSFSCHDALRSDINRLLSQIATHASQSDDVSIPNPIDAYDQGSLGDTEMLLRSILSTCPAHSVALCSLAVLWILRGEVDRGLESIHNVIDYSEDCAETRYRFGRVLKSLGRHGKAISQFFVALSLDPDSSAIEFSLGDALRDIHRTDEALYHLQRSIAIDNKFAPAWACKGLVLADLGRLDEARLAFEQAITLAPRSATGYYGLVDLISVPKESPTFEAMERLSGEPTSMPESERPLIHFALGRALERLGQYRESLQHYLRANALIRPSVTYNEDVELRYFASIRAIFIPEVLARRCDNTDTLPIFVVGEPRSGSTLLEQILASHPAVFGAGEVSDFSDLVLELGGGVSKSAPGALMRLSKDQLTWIGKLYVERLRRCAPRAKFIVDKQLSNFSWLGLVHMALPAAKIIHIRRNPIDTCVSMFSRHFKDTKYSYDLGELGRHYREYDRLMRHWIEILPPSSLMNVSYEDLVEDLETNVRQIIGFCGLQWSDKCLHFDKTRRPVYTLSNAQVRRPVYKYPSSRWMPCRDLLRPLLDALGPQLAGEGMPVETTPN